MKRIEFEELYELGFRWLRTDQACSHCKNGEPIWNCTCRIHIDGDMYGQRSGCSCWKAVLPGERGYEDAIPARDILQRDKDAKPRD